MEKGDSRHTVWVSQEYCTGRDQWRGHGEKGSLIFLHCMVVQWSVDRGFSEGLWITASTFYSRSDKPFTDTQTSPSDPALGACHLRGILYKVPHQVINGLSYCPITRACQLNEAHSAWEIWPPKQVKARSMMPDGSELSISRLPSPY